VRDAVIVDSIRTPIGKRNGRLKDVHPALLSAAVMTAVLARSGVEPEAVEQVIWGCVTKIGEQSMNVGRNGWLAAGLPIATAATTIDTQCGSSQQAIHLAASLVQSGACEIVLAGGVESMSRIPIGADAMAGPGSPYPPELMERFDLVNQGIAAEMVARKYSISRAQMDDFAVQSHTRAARAAQLGLHRSRLLAMPIPGDDAIFDQDEGIRFDVNLEAVSRLRPAFDPAHSITAGNSSQISDGAAAVLVMSSQRASALGLPARARIAACAVVGCDPVLMLEGPIPATRAVLKRAGLELSEIDLFEVNEAFASVPLAWLAATGADSKKLNVNGGAIAIGHPLGGSGARIMHDLLFELERRDLRVGLETMCVGGGLGTATIIDRQMRPGS